MGTCIYLIQCLSPASFITNCGIMLKELLFVNGELTAWFSLPILSLRNIDIALPLNGGGLPASGSAIGDQGLPASGSAIGDQGLPASGGAKGDQGFGWG